MFTNPDKVILLDIGNVIVNVDFGAFCSAVAAVSGDEQAVFEKFCAGNFKDEFDRGAISIVGFLEQMACDPLVRNISFRELKDAWQNIFSLKPGAAEGIARLKECHRVWIMSDTDPLHFTALLNRFPVLRTMEQFYLSYEHGFLKNSPEAFIHVMQTSGNKPDELLLIDDKPENCLACRKAGIESILFTDWSDIQARPDICWTEEKPEQ